MIFRERIGAKVVSPKRKFNFQSVKSTLKIVQGVDLLVKFSNKFRRQFFLKSRREKKMQFCTFKRKNKTDELIFSEIPKIRKQTLLDLLNVLIHLF
jgi:hypothetical protein